MTKRVKSKYKINRRLGVNLWGRPKSSVNLREYGPGEHGQRRRKPSDYGLQLQAKQKLKGYYGNITEKKFRRYYEEAVRRKGDTSEILVGELERLYNSDLEREQILIERVSVFDRAKSRYRSVRHTLLESPSLYDGFLDWSVNNARLLSYRRYHDLDDFETLFNACGKDLRRMVEVSRSCAVSAESPRECLRDRTAELTLDQPDPPRQQRGN